LVQGRQPGWYADPYNPPPSQRYWDGTAWTERIRAADQRKPAGPTQPAGWYPDGSGNAQVERLKIVALTARIAIGAKGAIGMTVSVGSPAAPLGKRGLASDASAALPGKVRRRACDFLVSARRQSECRR
jgi:hypothetical protein